MKLKPFNEVLQSANEYAAAGITTHQRFQCEACGNDTLGIAEPNTFYEYALCDKCNHVTNLRKNGCNFLIIFSS